MSGKTDVYSRLTDKSSPGVALYCGRSSRPPAGDVRDPALSLRSGSVARSTLRRWRQRRLSRSSSFIISAVPPS